MCCFVLLIPTPEEYRIPRVNPGVTASKLFPPLLPSLATPGPPLPYRPLQKSRYYYPRFRVGSSICLASSVGCAEGAGGIPISSWVVDMCPHLQINHWKPIIPWVCHIIIPTKSHHHTYIHTVNHSLEPFPYWPYPGRKISLATFPHGEDGSPALP